MHDDSHEVDHLTSGCGDPDVSFDPSGELAPPLPPLDIDVQPDASLDVMGLGQPGSTDVSYDGSYDVAPDVTAIPVPDTLPPAETFAPEGEIAPDVTTIPPPDAPPPAPLADAPADGCGPPPAPTFAVEGEGSFDVTGLGQPGHPDVAPDTSIDVIGLGQPGNDGPVDTAAPGAIDVIGLGQPGNEGPVETAAPYAIDVIGLGQPGNPVIDAPTVGFVGGSAPLEMTIVPGDGSTQVSDQSAGLGVISGAPDDPLAQVLDKTTNPLTEAQLFALMNEQRIMNRIWTSDHSSSS